MVESSGGPDVQPHDNSVTQWIDALRADDSQAAQNLWQRYLERLVRTAAQKLGSAPRRMADEEDVAIAVFHAFLQGVKDERFARLNDRNDLWQILVMLTERTAIGQRRREQAGKRGGGQVRGESVFGAAGSSTPGIAGIAAADPTPEFAADFHDQLQSLLNGLPDDTQRTIAMARLEGKSNAEIAAELQIAVRSVERKLNLIRRRWQEMLGP